MAKLTNAQLAAQLEAAHVSYQALEAKYEALRAQPAARPLPHRDAVTIAHDNYARALLAAREMAMRTGRVVRIG